MVVAWRPQFSTLPAFARVDRDLKAVAPARILRVRRLGVAADDALGGNRGLGEDVKVIQTPLSIFCAENHKYTVYYVASE